MFAGREEVLSRINSETQCGYSSRFGSDSIMDKRASYYFLCGAVFGQMTRNAKYVNNDVFSVVESLKNQIDSGSELVRISNAWAAGAAFGHGTI